MPSTTIRPDCTRSSPLMQRSMVDLPEPERPMTATISPFSTLSETPFSTSTGPKLLWMSVISTSGMGSLFEMLAQPRQAEADDEVGDGGEAIDLQRLEGGGAEDLAGPGEFDE